MSSKVFKHKPEDMLMRVIRVAELLANGSRQRSHLSIDEVKQTETYHEGRSEHPQNTQKSRPRVRSEEES